MVNIFKAKIIRKNNNAITNRITNFYYISADKSFHNNKLE